MIWFKEYSLKEIAAVCKSTMVNHIGIDFIEISENSLVATMPVDERTKQPAGLLHGGASVALAETLGSIASWMVIDSSSNQAVGLEINANHLRAQTSGMVTGRVLPIHIGRRTHIWEIKITGSDGKLACVSRLTVAVIDKK